jgi:hypothetical protein
MPARLLRPALACLTVLVAAFAAGCVGEPPQDLICTSDGQGNHLRWSPLDGALSYKVYRFVNASGVVTGPEFLGSTEDTRFTDANVTQGNHYEYFVTGENKTGETAPATCEVTSVPFFATPLAWGAAVVGAAGLVGVVLMRRS